MQNIGEQGVKGYPAVVLGEVIVIKPPLHMTMQHVDTIAAELPHRSLYPNELLTVDVISRFDRFVQTAVVEITAADGLNLIQVTNSNADLETIVTKNTVSFGTLYVVSVVRKRGSQISRDTQKLPTDEKLFALHLKVDKSASASAPGKLAIKLRRDQTFDMADNQLRQRAPSHVRGRSGVQSGSNTVHFSKDVVVGVLPYVTTLAMNPIPVAAEKLNTAKLTGKAIEMPIVIEGVRRRGGFVNLNSDESILCQSANTNVLKIRQTPASKCTAILDGSETLGGLVKVAVTKHGVFQPQMISFRVHVLKESSLALKSSNGNKLRPIAGYHDEKDATCQALRFQETTITGTASFSDGMDEFVDYDVTALLRLSSSNTNIVSAGNGQFGQQRVQAWGNGSATINVVGYHQVALALEVADPRDPTSHLVPVGLAHIVLSSLGQLTVNPAVPLSGFERDTTVTITVADPTRVVLTQEGQSARVAVSALFADGSWMPLTEEDGLVLTSNNQKAVVVDTQAQQRVYVPTDPIAASGKLLQAAWHPRGKCSQGALATHAIDLKVAPALPTRLEIHLEHQFIVARNNPAANTKVPAFSTATTTTVYAIFTGNRRVDITLDPRTTYLSTNDALFSVDGNGHVVSNTNQTVGTGRVTAMFRGASGEKKLSVAKFQDLVLSAVPYPAYSGSNNHPVKQLRPIACTHPVIHQQALMSTQIVLTNGVTATIDANAIEYIVSPSGIVSEFEGKISPLQRAAGTIKVFAKFKALAKPEDHSATSSIATTSRQFWEIKVSHTHATITSMDNLRLVSAGKPATMLTGSANVTSGQIALAVTLDDGTKYENAVNVDGVLLRGAFQFSSTDAARISVDSVTGKATLRANAAAPVKLVVTAMSCSHHPIAAHLAVHANLRPAFTGDVDLGSKNGSPLAACAVGKVVEVPVAVNTGQKVLSGFEMTINYNPAHLRYLKYTANVAGDDGKADVLASQRPSSTSTLAHISINGLIQNSHVRGSEDNPYSLFTVTFECIAGGETYLGGHVLKLIEAITNANIGRASKRHPVLFKAGFIALIIHGQRLRRSLPLELGTSQNTKKNNRQQVENRRELWRDFDANCDGEFGVDDGAVIQSYVAFGNADLRIDSNPAWATFSRTVVAQCNVTYDYDKHLDLDRNKAITLLDATYLQNVLVGYYYFVDLQVPQPVPNTCDTTVRVVLQGVSSDGQSAVDPQDVDVLIDVATEKHDPAVIALLHASGKLVTDNKGSKDLFGGLVRATQSLQDPQAFVFTFANLGPQLIRPIKILLTPLLVKSKRVTDTWLHHNHPFLDVLSSSSSAHSTLSGTLFYDISLFETSGGKASTLIRKNGYSPMHMFEMHRNNCAKIETTTNYISTASASTTTHTMVTVSDSTSRTTRGGTTLTAATTAEGISGSKSTTVARTSTDITHQASSQPPTSAAWHSSTTDVHDRAASTTTDAPATDIVKLSTPLPLVSSTQEQLSVFPSTSGIDSTTAVTTNEEPTTFALDSTTSTDAVSTTTESASMGRGPTDVLEFSRSSTATTITTIHKAVPHTCHGAIDPPYCGSVVAQCSTSDHVSMLCPVTCSTCDTDGFSEGGARGVKSTSLGPATTGPSAVPRTCHGTPDRPVCGDIATKCSTSHHIRLLCPATCFTCDTDTKYQTTSAAVTESDSMQRGPTNALEFSRSSTATTLTSTNVPSRQDTKTSAAPNATTQCACSHRNQTYMHGQIWNHGCTTCFCHNVRKCSAEQEGGRIHCGIAESNLVK